MLAMKTLNEHIKKGEYQKVYLIYGEEEYLKNQYRDRMKAAIIGDDTINYSYFEGDSTKAEDVISMCETMPFFSDRRLVIVSDSSFFKNANDKLADYIKKLPGYIVLIFVEKNVDKRNKVYKAVSSCGYVTEMKYQTPAMLKKWIAGMLSKEHYKVTEAACDLILEKTGANMELIRNEVNKLISYCAGRDAVMQQDVEAVCSTQTTSRIFEMIEAVAGKNRDKALSLYYDLLELKESPMLILYLIVRQFNGILQAKDYAASGMSSREVASYMKIQPFIAGKYLAQSKYFTADKIKEILRECADVEERIKQGRLQEKLGVEMIIIKYSV
jgi:DNA polymerase-3 subunit delta